ncbi:uncharacterized protein LOC125950820 [Anopheles darlingi]|uniref:uncharacterized protein LOC125950820 n=1 Tax=Anopheles darlingi TaxID=43151 RepID=UPI0021002F7A|nr:uncharacterized protein LOC125950820 [Anopheles darlingi]XP_049535097.1 uncharacterized protein LOC125950820 [Anopheles darlingi]
MSWVFHLLWMFLVLMLFFIVLRRIYYFGLHVNRPIATSSRQTRQRFTVFTIYQGEQRSNAPPSEQSQPPEYIEPQPPPKYDDVIKSPEQFQKPPPYAATAVA